MVTAIVGHPGQMVGDGRADAEDRAPACHRCRPSCSPPAALSASSTRASRVLLRYSAFPYQKFGEYWGTVVERLACRAEPEEVKSLLAGAAHRLRSRPARSIAVIVNPDSQLVSIYGEVRTLAGRHAGAGLCAARSAAALSVDPRAAIRHWPRRAWALNRGNRMTSSRPHAAGRGDRPAQNATHSADRDGRMRSCLPCDDRRALRSPRRSAGAATAL